MRRALAICVLCLGCSLPTVDRLVLPPAVTPPCPPNATQACACPSGVMSTQVCAADGSHYGTCDCVKQLVFAAAPADAAAGIAIPGTGASSPQVIIADAGGARVLGTSLPITIALARGTGTLSGTLTVTASDGLAIFPDLSIDRAGSGKALSASAGTLGATSGTFTVIAGTATQLGMRVQPPASGLLGHALTPAPQVELRDAFGNPAQGQATIVTQVNETGYHVNDQLIDTSGGAATLSRLFVGGVPGTATLHFSAEGFAPVDSSAIAFTLPDYNWPLWPMPDSPTAFCTDTAHSPSDSTATSYCTDPTVIPFQDGLIVSPFSQTAQPEYFIDNVTGLIWSAPTPFSAGGNGLADNAAYCASLHTAQLNWRMPTRIELASIIDYGVPVAPSATAYMSATPCPSAGGQWIAVDTGQVKYAGPPASVRCVAGFPADLAFVPTSIISAPPGQYTVATDVVTDNVTGLMWQRNRDTATHTWSDALTYCNGLSLGGVAGWRAPTEKELLTIVNDRVPTAGGGGYPNVGSADFGAFPDSDLVHGGSFFYWSSTPVRQTGSSHQAWVIEFGRGTGTTQDLANANFVRCVRAQ